MSGQTIDTNALKKIVQQLTRPSLTEKIKLQVQSSSAPESKNPIKAQGKAYANRHRKLQGRSGSIAKSEKEQEIHEIIRDNPILLHTPELYSGGLYLNAVVSKHRLPCLLVPDFLYITVHNRVIRFTLVEIEKPAHGVFSGSSFMAGVNTGLTQVRKWITHMEPRAQREALLLNLKGLFEHYPIELFTADGSVSKNTQIEMGYVLIVGSETIESDLQQKMVDELYLKEGILFMTYPMMVEQVKRHPLPKNMLKSGPHGISAFKLDSPEIFLRKGPYIGHERLEDNDPYGITTGALGWKIYKVRLREYSRHPESMKEIFYRANGQCEHPECAERIVQDGEVHGNLGRIYNMFEKASDVSQLWNTDYTPLLCPKHREASNATYPPCSLFSDHPMKLALQARRPYRPHLDAELSICLAKWRDSIGQSVLNILEIDQKLEPGFAAQIHEWMLAVTSLPWQWAMLLKDLVLDHFQIIRWYEVSRAEKMLDSHPGWRYLLRAGLIRVNPSARAHLKIEPNVFSRAFIDRVLEKFPENGYVALADVCTANVYKLASRGKELGDPHRLVAIL
jgi:hypothetical protein